KLCQLQLGGFAYYDLPLCNQDYLQALSSYLPSSLTILNLLNIYDYTQPSTYLRYFIEKAKYLRYIEIVRLENYNIEKQKKSEIEIFDLCQARNIQCHDYIALCHMHGYGPEPNKEMALSIATYLHKKG
ncbi:15701_t:CDS:2, partial [Cetraspora pellucida]